MIVVSDTSAITALIQVRHENLLAELYKTILVPPAVKRELGECHLIPQFISCIAPKNPQRVHELLDELEIGEAEAIVLAKEIKADWLLLDEIKARRVAAREGVRFIGLLGVLLEAKRLDRIGAIRPIVEQLERVANFRISENIKQQIFTAANE